MTIAIMQPYFCPYIGYWQLMKIVDVFVVYDNIEYTKKGWINRNRILIDGKDEYISLSLKKDSDYLNVNERFLSEQFHLKEIRKITNKITEAYRKAPMFNEIMPMIEKILLCHHKNLFDYIYNSLLTWKDFLNINTKIIKSSSLSIDIEKYKGQDKVIAICKSLNADQYINPIGGLELYSVERFKEHNIKLNFIKSKDIIYQQFKNIFVPWLSIIDVAMFNDKETIYEMLNNFEYHF